MFNGDTLQHRSSVNADGKMKKCISTLYRLETLEPRRLMTRNVFLIQHESVLVLAHTESRQGT